MERRGPERSGDEPVGPAFAGARASAAVTEAMHLHDRRLRRYLSQLLGIQETEDAVQEVYARLLHVSRTIGYDTFGLAYLKRTAENVALDILRRRRVRHAADHVELDTELASGQPTPFDHTSGRQNVDHLKQAIKTLPPLQRRILLMHRLDGMSLAEVAVELGVPLRTVQRHLVNGLAACRLHLQRLGWFETE